VPDELESYGNCISVLYSNCTVQNCNFFFPLGMNKMVINHLEKLFVTNDAATILRELEVSSLRISVGRDLQRLESNCLTTSGLTKN